MAESSCDRANTHIPTARVTIFEAGQVVDADAMSVLGVRADADHLACTPEGETVP